MSDSQSKQIRIHRLQECPEFIAGDKTLLRELFNPNNHTSFSGRYSLAHATLGVGESSIPHRLKNHELYYILSGSAQMHIDDQSADVCPGDAIEIPPKSLQWIENRADSELIFLCIVDPGWRSEDEIVEPPKSG